MKNYLIVDAITQIDDDLIAEYLETKQEMLFKRKKATGFKINRKGWVALAACFILIMSSVVAMLIMRYSMEDDVQTPDKLCRYEYGETCFSQVGGVNRSSIKFTEVFLTDSIQGQSGQYIVFLADIQTQSYSFSSKDINLGLTMIKSPDYLIKNKTVFEKDLSLEVSEITLIIDETNGEMNGKVAFVFSIDDENFYLIKSQSSQTSYENNIGDQITLEPGIYWCGGKASFVFKTAEVPYVQNIN